MKKIELLDHGYVELQDVMGDDLAVVNAARISFLGESKGADKDFKLLCYLMKHGHMTPFEQVHFKFRVKTPLFVARQWFRYRSQHFNEVSRRYTEEDICFYIPEIWRKQAKDNKQASEGTIDEEYLTMITDDLVTWSVGTYQTLLAHGVAREMARMILPQSMYTTFITTVDARNLMHFLKERMDPHAQYEIRVYAEAIYQMMREVLPWTCEAFEKYILKGE